jgi:hypothetical protein
MRQQVGAGKLLCNLEDTLGIDFALRFQLSEFFGKFLQPRKELSDWYSLSHFPAQRFIEAQ